MTRKYPEYKQLNLTQIAHEMLATWDKEKTFERSVSNREGRTPFVFYEGPPSANGMPGIHHVIARTLKDLVCRYKTMQGFQVKRKGGWDTHGLPVELGVEKLLGIKVPATGLSIGVDRIAELLQLTKQAPKQVTGPVLIVVFDNNLMTEYQKIASQLRKSKIDTEVYYGSQRGLNKQLAYADKKNCPVAILLGENELAKAVVTVRDLKMGKQIASEFTDKTEWQKTSQFEVKREDLVKKVKELIKKHQ